MMRAIALVLGFHSVRAVEHLQVDDDAEALSLLQMKAIHTTNGTDESVQPGRTGFWRHGGCRTQLGEIVTCGWDSDMHMRGRFVSPWNPDWHEVGLRAGAYTTDDSLTMQIFQCPWNADRPASTAGIAMQMGDHLFEFLRNPNCQEEPFVLLNGERLFMHQLPKTMDDGLFIEGYRGRNEGICIDSADGKSSATVRYRMNSRGDCNNMRRQAWWDMDLKLDASVAVKNDDSACGGSFGGGNEIRNIRKIDFETEQSLFSSSSHDHLCQHCDWGGRGPCEKPPPVPPPPPSQQNCEAKGCSYETAQRLCSSLESHEAAYEDCLVDICATCGDDTDPIAIAQNAIENEEEMEPGPCCVDSTSTCGLPTDICTDSVKMNIFNQVTNNLGGVGPDAGAEEIRFSRAAAVKGQILDLIIKSKGGSYRAKSPASNGKMKSGAFGQINLKTKSEVELEFSWVDAETGASVTLEQVSISFYDVDEGKKGKSRTTLTACGADNAILTTNTELTLSTVPGCYAVSSSTHGTAADNPTSPSTLTPRQAARSVTFPFSNVDKATVTYAIGKGYGARNVFFLVEPTLACEEGFDPDLPCSR